MGQHKKQIAYSSDSEDYLESQAISKDWVYIELNSEGIIYNLVRFLMESSLSKAKCLSNWVRAAHISEG
jgi:hypothetical protein